MYAALNELNTPERTLMTIEDPVEYLTPGVDQIEVNTRAGLTFARGLRTVLRSDPDVILIGEIRDEETAQIAIRAAMTGHLVCSTLHSQTAASAIRRFTDMGVEPGLLAATLTCLVAQRLTRRICPDCRETYKATKTELVALGLPNERAGRRLLTRGRGCAACGGTGYRGRIALFEVLVLTDEIRELIAHGASTVEIHRTAVAGGMRALRDDGNRVCLEGITTLSEIQRVVGDRTLELLAGLLLRVDLRRRSRPQGPGELDVRRRFPAAPLLDERSREAVVGVLVRRGQIHQRAELGLGLLPATEPEVRNAERLPNRARPRFPALRLLECNRRLGGPSRAEVRAPLLEEVVRFGHRPTPVTSRP